MSTGQKVDSKSVAPARTLAQLGARRTFASMAWRRFRQNKLAMLGLAVMIVIILIALGAGLISRYITGFSPSQQSLMTAYSGVGENGHLLGSDDVGRDVATRLAYGARVSLGVAGLAVLGAVTIGLLVGLTAGFYGRWLDSILMRFVDMVLAIPTIFLLLLVATMFVMGPLMLAGLIAAVAWVVLSRLIRGEVIAIRNREFVEAARVMGAKDNRLIIRHVLPNVLPVMIVWASLAVPGLILTEAALSYLGLGIRPPTPSWGNMLTTAQRVWVRSPSLAIFPGLAIYITVFAINLMGNGLRDALDPRLTNK